MIEAVRHVHAANARQFQAALSEVANEAKAKDCEIEIPHFLVSGHVFDAIIIVLRPDNADSLVAY